MEKYIGTYRVCCEFDKATLEPIKDDNWIQCYKDGQIYRVNGDLLAYYRPTRGNSNQLCDDLVKLGLTYIENRSTDGDVLIYFKEKDLDVVTKKVGVITSGANIKPYSVKNLRKLKWFKDQKDKYIRLGYYRELSEEEKEVLRERFTKNIKNNN